MEFQVRELQPKGPHYQDIMEPIWERLVNRLSALLDADWEPFETPGPALLKVTAEVDDPRIDHFEIKGESEDIEEGLIGGYQVTITKWRGLALYTESTSEEQDVDVLVTEWKPELEDAATSLKEVYEKELETEFPG